MSRCSYVYIMMRIRAAESACMHVVAGKVKGRLAQLLNYVYGTVAKNYFLSEFISSEN